MVLDFLDPPLEYERRLVVFYDILGWRSKITWAGTDPSRIRDLQTTVLMYAKLARSEITSEGEPVRITSFSDNVVHSESFRPEALTHLCFRLGLLQLGAATAGFLIRGAITAGNIIHTNDIVFGPALNRAYELESTMAVVPRIIIDPDIVAQLGDLPPMIVKDEDGLYFIDPFTRKFEKFVAAVGERQKQAHRTDGLDFLKKIRETMRVSMRDDWLPEKEWAKNVWLFDRIAKELGMPTASSYPRARPKDAV
jgi:hypothetical protein